MNPDATLYPEGLSMLRAVPPATLLYAIANANSYIEAIDAINECEHGCLPTDKPENRERAGCTCFVVQPAAVESRRKVATEVRHYGEAMAQLQAATEAAMTYVIDLPPFIANVVAELDERVAELQAEVDRILEFKEAVTNG